MTTTEQGAPFVAGPGEGRAIWHIDNLMTFKALTDDTGGRLAAWEQLLPHRSSPPLHVHSDADEAWFVLDGTITFRVQEDEFSAEAGSFVWAPRGLAHTFRVDSPTARVLGLALPGGFDRFVLATGRPAEALTLPPPPDGPPDMGALAGAAREHGMEVLGPPLS
ncbi:cupin domain-containing protein [Blastococcus sp. CT_GayMR20]|uniref:cupin domain-containing protein n=1 Tax=Blastococcus sp. CT_GayMR20 TaxID=2559609 RepID=UPI001073F97E|nr:cupin domain-containing protein [Blastococcus sp. CT_GayMR20]TFV81303.1 cupin domain-containing protein [Blastococcus sp. CT_GayMR20]